MTQRVDPPTLYLPETEHDACGLGFVAHIKGHKSRAIVEDALEILRRLAHRAAAGQDPETGDGSGILLQLPHRFFKREGLARGWEIPRRRGYGVAMVFLPAEETPRRLCEAALEEAVRAHGQRVIGWRDVPVEPAVLGPLARALRPVVRQLYIGRRRLVPSAFERKLFVIRKAAEARVRDSGADPQGRFHVASCSAETIVYKGLMLPHQLGAFYPDLGDVDMVSALALVHSRFSTNTQPAWERAQPFRYVAHNGEINTVAGNRNWMEARRRLLKSAKFDGGVEALFPVIVPGGSDSAQFDNMLELLHLGGRSLPHAMMMMIPEAWEAWPTMDDTRRAFYEYAASLMEPWDGPAAIAFTDGHLIGATLDRNGLRPCRYLVTDDDRVILASETGVIDVPPERVRQKDRLRPGRMLIVDTEEGRIIDDAEVKAEIAGRWPYRRWLNRNVFRVGDFDPVAPPPPLEGEALARQARAFGYTDEDLDLVLAPMAEDGKEPIGAMGNDAPLAVLSARAPSLFHYFHQRFAQVTNPPIDPLREAAVMSLETSVGPQGNTFEETPEQCHRLRLDGPVLTNAELARIASLQVGAFEPTTLAALYRPGDGPQALAAALEALCAAAVEAVDDGYNILILSDRGVDAEHAPIPALLATSAVHHHLIREGIRLHTGLLVSTGEAREVHHFAALIGYGASAVNPWLAMDLLEDRHAPDASAAQRRFIEAIDAGLLKIMAKMGISTLQSYRGGQIFEAVGLDRALVDRHFAGTPSRIGGIGLDVLAREAEARHARGFAVVADALALLPVGGDYRWRRRGEAHRWNPRTVALLQAAAKTDDAVLFAEWEAAADDLDGAPTTLRGLFAFAPGEAVPLAEVEPAAAIVRRFVTGAMSFGSISAEAHETLAIAMNRIGGRSNCGEGGEEPHRARPDANGDRRRSAIKQVASGRFGVTADYLVDADDLQIKVAQGAKPGEGGQLPGEKVDERIARVRCSTPGVTLISPPPHHDIYSIEDLKQLIYDLQAVNPTARISVKLVASAGVGTVAAGVAKAGADAIVISGFEGGTGAAPLSSIKRAGLPWELGIAEAQQVLVQNGLRGVVRLQVDGGIRTARDVMVAALLGAEEYGFATAALIVEGCVLLRRCHQNTCSVGVATQDPALRARFAGQPEHVVQYMLLVAESLRRLMARLGFRALDEAIGRADRLVARALPADEEKARALDLAPLLTPAPQPGPRRCVGFRPRAADTLDEVLLPAVAAAIEGGAPVVVEQAIGNVHRAVGARLAGEVARRRAGRPLPDGAITVRFGGSAGQSFGAFLPQGVAFELVGDGNDYLGKGLSGGRIAVRPPEASRFRPEQNVIIGNTVLYGATGGELYAVGHAGERFAVRNSGARAVVEGCGDHGCEYMTGGVVAVLGPTGRNFAAGMSGGVAFVFDREGEFRGRCNPEMVELGALDDSDEWLLRALVEDHFRHTRSALGQLLLQNWKLMLPRFVRVMPVEYRRALARQAAVAAWAGPGEVASGPRVGAVAGAGA
ncbi:MAG: glutamate synthase large subunit [bacterium]